MPSTIKKIIEDVRQTLKLAIKEDCPSGDITSAYCVPAKSISTALLVAKEAMVLSGLPIFKEVMLLVDKKLSVKLLLKDGDKVKKGAKVITVEGKSRSILKGERVALNYLQRMCGVATLTAKFVKELKGAKTEILDTRKTTPNMRKLEKYAVICGGGINHRHSLSDQPLIKENHIKSAGGIGKAIEGVRRMTGDPIILEVRNKKEVLEGLKHKADILLLDNMKPAEVKKMVALINSRALTEVSGGITLENVKSYGQAGVDRISSGSLTHSVPSADLSLLFR